MKYSEERKESVLKKMMPPHNWAIPGGSLGICVAINYI